jgi:predicted nucleic acid-binding protein
VDVVLDASATLSWLFDDERDDRSRAMLDQLRSARAFVPALWRWEVQNALLISERQSRLAAEEAQRMLEDLQSLRIEIEAVRNEMLGAEIALARRFSLTAYDAAYLDLAIRRDAPLMTRDAKLADAAKQMGLLWTP